MFKRLKHWLGGAPEAPAGGPLHKRVLVVDDDEGIRRIVSLHLESMGYEPEVYPSAEAAWKHLNKHAGRYRLMVIDVHLQGESGLDLTRKIRSDNRFKRTPVLIMSGVVPPSELERVEDAVARVAILNKPFHIEKFKSAVDELLHRGRDMVDPGATHRKTI
jgi:DNA-binding response OmpR family regulator